MAEISRFTPPATRAYRYLNGLYPGKVFRETPPAGYEPAGDEVIIVKTGGGAGAHTHQLFDALLSFDVRAPTSARAEALAYQVEKSVREWEWVEDRVYLRSSGVPVWDPAPETRTPAYTWTASFTFKSTGQ